MHTQMRPQDQATFYRFQVFQANLDREGKLHKTRGVGMAYLREGQQIFTVRLWMLQNERFYLVQHRSDPEKYLIMTRELNRRENAKNKYLWNIVGNGTADSVQGVIRLDFDLLEKSIYINIRPEPSAYAAGIAEPEFVAEAA